MGNGDRGGFDCIREGRPRRVERTGCGGENIAYRLRGGIGELVESYIYALGRTRL